MFDGWYRVFQVTILTLFAVMVLCATVLVVVVTVTTGAKFIKEYRDKKGEFNQDDS